ncbi:unnamed protein product [Effrenium voratum]|nr:unnamed protein product [Effrenium voratum]
MEFQPLAVWQPRPSARPRPSAQMERATHRAPGVPTAPAIAGCFLVLGRTRRVKGADLSRRCKTDRRDKERRGRRGEDVIIAARERGLRSLELFTGLAAGPLAAWAYPWLRETAAQLVTGEEKLCFDFMGLCGSVPEAMQVFFRTTVGLLFSFVLGYTSSFLLVRQEKFYEAMYEESSILTQLLEEAPLLLERKHLLQLVKNLRLYLASSTWRNPSFIPSEMVARSLRSDKDPIEEITRLLISVQTPGSERLMNVVSALRGARSRKFSSMQRIIPTAQFGLLVILGLLITLSPFLDGKSDTSLLAQCLYGVLVEVLIIVIVYVGGGPGLGVYTTDKERSTILDALMMLVERIESTAEKEDTEDAKSVTAFVAS